MTIYIVYYTMYFVFNSVVEKKIRDPCIRFEQRAMYKFSDEVCVFA